MFPGILSRYLVYAAIAAICLDGPRNVDGFIHQPFHFAKETQFKAKQKIFLSSPTKISGIINTKTKASSTSLSINYSKILF